MEYDEDNVIYSLKSIDFELIIPSKIEHITNNTLKYIKEHPELPLPKEEAFLKLIKINPYVGFVHDREDGSRFIPYGDIVDCVLNYGKLSKLSTKHKDNISKELKQIIKEAKQIIKDQLIILSAKYELQDKRFIITHHKKDRDKLGLTQDEIDLITRAQDEVGNLIESYGNLNEKIQQIEKELSS